MNKLKVLFIAGKTRFYSELEQQLNQENILVNQLNFLQRPFTYFETEQPHLVVLNCPKHDVSELALCQEIRSIYSGLLILVSDQEDKHFQTLALNLGADASLTSLDGVLLVVANIQALLRRFISEASSPQFVFGGLMIDKTRRDAFINDKAVGLSSIEFQLIWSLARKSGCVVTREEIHRDIYNAVYNGYDRSIDLYVSRIRQKIGDDPVTPHYLKTVRGVGYQFVGIEKKLSNKRPL